MIPHTDVILLPHTINFNDGLPKSEEYSPKRGVGTDLGKQQFWDDLKQGPSKHVPNPFQIRQLEQVSWTFGPKDELWQPFTALIHLLAQMPK